MVAKRTLQVFLLLSVGALIVAFHFSWWTGALIWAVVLTAWGIYFEVHGRPKRGCAPTLAQKKGKKNRREVQGFLVMLFIMAVLAIGGVRCLYSFTDNIIKNPPPRPPRVLIPPFTREKIKKIEYIKTGHADMR